MIDLQRGVEILNTAERNFNIGDAVIAELNGVWYFGDVAEKTKESRFAPFITIKTDEVVDTSPNALLEGHGIRGRANNRWILFAYERPGIEDDIFTRTTERRLTKWEYQTLRRLERDPYPF